MYVRPNSYYHFDVYYYQRASFAHDITPLPIRPSRKYARVESSASVIAGTEGALVDAGLALGRSFRVGWGPGGTIAYMGTLCGPSEQSQTSANTSMVTKAAIPLCSGPQEDMTSRCSRLLQHHLSKTPIIRDEDGIPFADPPPELCFSSFVALYPATDRSYEAHLFRLGSSLFDDIDLRLGPSITVDVRNRISSIRRKSALSAWLQEAVRPLVDAGLKQLPSTNSAALAYAFLTGYQVGKACEVAMDGGNVKLATLLSQASGDFEFREDLKEQLQLWREQRIDAHMDENIRKVYSLLAGILDIVEGSKGSSLERSSDVDVLKGLDWKRAFGAHLWFSEPMDAPISQVFESYKRSTQESPSRVASPRPWYLETPHSFPHELSFKIPTSAPSDGLFYLIRLHAEPSCSLSQILSPLSFGPSPADYSFPWHLYIVLSRCMRVRDFADRGDAGISRDAEDSDEVRHEGHSPSADLLASSYAQQLEQLGMLQEAIFVLLHIEGSAGREKAIKDLLARSADNLDEWMTSGILGSLKIPLAWVNEAKALRAVHLGEIYEAYKLYISAGLLTAAHDLAVTELAPEAVIRNDLELLRSLFEGMSSNTVQGWYFRGKAYLDYVHVMTRIPELHAQIDPYAVPDAAQEEELEKFSRSVPKLIGLLPDILSSNSNPLHQVALAEMISGLTSVLDQVRPLALAQSQVPLSAIDEGTQLKHIKTSALERFMRSIQVS
ncbi:nuclear protein 96-domain-containing protein [Hygrophoropsis aurantiaca]|uniref:Nuclear protein 96-domain-containing protein n=1 Tax=Hygrophoropsis aurantiaca TaxID=72124 RepID=A0ACB8AAN7_9AGAM|nr:nuclear protein 96-domain-containing protein [Hygrophoropsis aurantiaca]